MTPPLPCDASGRAAVLGIDWQAPWFSPWQEAGLLVQQHLRQGLSLPEALNALARAPVRFMAQNQLPHGQAYEAHIHATGEVPTREGLHDFFNALCWMHFPRTKRRLNVLQGEVIARQGIASARGPLRDGATLMDENAALLQAPPELWAALRAHDWHQAMVTLRPLWASSRLWMFGHAALEKLARPYKSITVHLWAVPQDLPPPHIDAWLAQALSAEHLATKPFSPLPVLGVPGWWPDNEHADFYADATVFRPPRPGRA